ncbi:transposase [Rhizobium johnstonii]|uniref:transposase n=1 Tax=Rhizobium johnstonii TaxID=3019933 RepID=UPI003F9E7202
MTKHQIEVITSVERRRRWSHEDKERLVAACLELGAVLSEIARAAGIHVSQLFRWRKELCQIEGAEETETASTLVPVVVSEARSILTTPGNQSPSGPDSFRKFGIYQVLNRGQPHLGSNGCFAYNQITNKGCVGCCSLRLDLSLLIWRLSRGL